MRLAAPLLIPRLTLDSNADMDELRAALEAEVAGTRLECVNWSAFPYCPEVTFRLGHTGTALALMFDVKEKSVRALETRTHGAVHLDSCVEFFVSFDGASYYNLELSCIGTPHLAYGPGRTERRFVPLPLMERLAVCSSLGSEPFGEKTGGGEWSLTARVPLACFAFDALDMLDGRAARANFYKCDDGLPVKHYVTWQPVRTPAPDYHRPEFFGDIRFANLTGDLP